MPRPRTAHQPSIRNRSTLCQHLLRTPQTFSLPLADSPKYIPSKNIISSPQSNPPRRNLAAVPRFGQITRRPQHSFLLPALQARLPISAIPSSYTDRLFTPTSTHHQTSALLPHTHDLEAPQPLQAVALFSPFAAALESSPIGRVESIVRPGADVTILHQPFASPAMSSSVKRACDACHRRKVKCDGINPCRNCSSAQLSCTYHAIPQKKGPKGSRAKVISELRETQRQSTLSSKVANRLNGINSPPCSPTLTPTPGLLTNDMIKECIEFFFANMYPTLPILHRGRLEQQAMYADQNVDTYCLLTSLCAFMMIQPGMGIPGDPLGLDSLPGANLVSGNLLMEETLRVRKSYDYLETPTMNSLATSFFLFGCYFGLDLHNKAWFHLREATTLAHILGLTKEDTYSQFDAVESSRRRRLYWLLFVTER